MECSMLSVLLMACATSFALSAAPDGYEYGFIGFGEADPQTLQPQVSLASGDQFGKVVAMWNGKVVVASNQMAVDSTTGQAGYQGKVFMFHRDYLLQWSDSEQYFTSGSLNDGYGSSLALYSGLLAIGAPQDSTMGENRGKVYLYTGDTFGTTTSVVATEHADRNDYFGSSVAITHGFTDYYGVGTLVVGAWGHNKDKEHEGAGCVFIFAQLESNVWTEVGVIEPSFPVNHGGFGYSVASFGNALVVGSYGSDHAHVFEMHGYLHECPHEDRDHHAEDMPADCQDQDRRLGGGPPDENKKYYTEWKYTEALMIGFNAQREGHEAQNKNSIQHFGSSVAIYNSSGVLTVAVGCSECRTDNEVEVGAVYVFSKLAKDDAAEGWFPDDYQPRREGEGDHKRLLRSLQGNEGDHQQQQQEEERKFLWDPFEHDSHASREGEFWFTEGSFWGRIQYEHFGWSVAIDGETVLVGSNPKTYLQGRAEVYTRSSVVNAGPDFVQSGPFMNKVWRWTSNLQDKSGITGDKYGYSVALHGRSAIVGSILSGLQEDGSFGSGAAYVYEKMLLMKISDAPTPRPTQAPQMIPGVSGELTNTHSVLGVSFITFSGLIGFCCMMVLFYGVYRVNGGTSSPSNLIKETFGINFSTDEIQKSARPLHLSSIDDSTTSSDAGSTRGFMPNRGSSGSMSAYSGLNTSSTHSTASNITSSTSSSSRKFQPRPQYVPKGPPRPTYSPANKSKGRGLEDL